MTRKLLTEGVCIAKRSCETSQISMDDGSEYGPCGIWTDWKATMGKNKFLQSVFKTEVCVRSFASVRATATGMQQILGIWTEMRKL